jgi:hypothetical protein
VGVDEGGEAPEGEGKEAPEAEEALGKEAPEVEEALGKEAPEGRAQGSSSGRGQGTSGGYTRGRFRVSPVQDPLRARSRSPLRTEETRPVPRPIRPSQMGRPRVVNREGSHSPRTQLGPVGTTGEDVNRGLPRKFSLDFD